MVRPWGYFAQWSKSDGKTNTVWAHFYVESNKTIGLKVLLPETDGWQKHNVGQTLSYNTNEFWWSNVAHGDCS